MFVRHRDLFATAMFVLDGAIIAAAWLAGYWLRRRGRNLRHAVVVGTGELAATLIHKLHEHADFGILVRGVLAAGDADPHRERVAGARVIGRVEDLPGIVEQSGAELVYLALPR